MDSFTGNAAPMTIRISALICTRNRADYLRRAIQSLIDQTLPNDQYEIIVVDNGSEDATQQVIGEFSGAPQFRSLYEPVPGLSRARNTAWQNARAPYVCYLDDDAVAHPDWLEKYLEVFQNFQPMPSAVGGKCEPIWEAPQPVWLADQMLTSLSVYDWSDAPIILNSDQWISGCNIGFPVSVLRELGGFREDLGRKGTKLLSGEETFLRRELDARGYLSVYHPEIIVGHHISPRRLTKQWFRRHAYGTGQSAAIMARVGRSFPIGERVQLSMKRVLWTMPRMPLAVLSTRPSDRFRRLSQVFETMGYLKGLWST
jgi:glycosyltransferase involved in cell wall biosynthesis